MRIEPIKPTRKNKPWFLQKFQFGGLPGFNIPASLANAFENTDFGDWSSIQSAATSVGGQNVADAFAQDNPDLITGNVMQSLAYSQGLSKAYEQNPIRTAEQIDADAEAAAKRRTFLGIGKKKAKRKAAEELQGMNDRRIANNENLAGAYAPIENSNMVTQYAGMANLMALLDGFQFQQGGPTNFEQRIQHPTLSLVNKDGTKSSHKMMSFGIDGKHYAAPTIVEVNGALVELSPEEAINYAMSTGEYKEFKTERQARRYAENGYKKGTPMDMRRFQQGGKPMPSPKVGFMRGMKLVPSGTENGQVVEYDLWKGRKLLGKYFVEPNGPSDTRIGFRSIGDSRNQAPMLVDDRDYPEDGLSAYSGFDKLGYFQPGKDKSYKFVPIKQQGGKYTLDDPFGMAPQQPGPLAPHPNTPEDVYRDQVEVERIIRERNQAVQAEQEPNWEDIQKMKDIMARRGWSYEQGRETATKRPLTGAELEQYNKKLREMGVEVAPGTPQYDNADRLYKPWQFTPRVADPKKPVPPRAQQGGAVYNPKYDSYSTGSYAKGTHKTYKYRDGKWYVHEPFSAGTPVGDGQLPPEVEQAHRSRTGPLVTYSVTDEYGNAPAQANEDITTAHRAGLATILIPGAMTTGVVPVGVSMGLASGAAELIKPGTTREAAANMTGGPLPQKKQTGGNIVPYPDGPLILGKDTTGRPTIADLAATLEENRKTILGLKNDEQGKAMAIAVLADMGYVDDLSNPKEIDDVIKRYKEHNRINISPKKGGDNTLDKGTLQYIADEYRNFQLDSWGYGVPYKMQTGGAISQLGYSMNSPYQNLPAIDIPGNNITMANTNRPLMAYPNVGHPRLLPPFSGTHIFPGATSVREVPLRQQGGNADTLTPIDKQIIAEQDAIGAPVTAITQNPDGSRSYHINSASGNFETVPRMITLPSGYPLGGYSVTDGASVSAGGRKPVEGSGPGHTVWERPKSPPLARPSGPGPQMRKGGKPKKYYQAGGPGSSAVGAQLEDGEFFVTGNVDIMETAARDKHKNMKSDMVTDILGKEDYVFSAMDNRIITRKQAEAASFGYGGMLYEEGEKPDLPVETTAASIFKDGEQELSITDYVKRVRDKYKVRSMDEADIFTKKTNAANKEARIPFLMFASGMNESKRKGKGKSGWVSSYENMFEDSIMNSANLEKEDGEYGIHPNQGGDTPEFQAGGGVLAALSGLSPLLGIGLGIGQLGANKNNYRDTTKFLAQDRNDINSLAQTQSQFSGLSTAAQMAGILGQDPYVEAPQFDTTQLDATIRRTPRSVFDLQVARLSTASRPYMNQLFNNAGSFSEAVNAYSPVAASNASSMADIGMNQALQDISMENNYRLQKQGYADRQVLADVGARNATKDNANRLTNAFAGVTSAGIEGQGQIESQRQNALRANNQAKLQSVMAWRQGKANAWKGILGNVGAGSQALYNTQLLKMYPPTNGVQTTTGVPDLGPYPEEQSMMPPPPLPWESPDMNSYLYAPMPYYPIDPNGVPTNNLPWATRPRG